MKNAWTDKIEAQEKEIARLTRERDEAHGRIERITFVMNGLLQNDLDDEKSGALEKIAQILKGETP